MKVLVPRRSYTGGHADTFAQELQLAGYDVICQPLTRIVGHDEAIFDLLTRQRDAHWDWIVVTSATTVKLLGEFWSHLPSRVKIAAIGSSTARAVENAGGRIDLTAKHACGAGLADELAARVSPQSHILVPHSAQADPSLVATLKLAQLDVEDVCLYHTETIPQIPQTLLENWSDLGVIVLLASSQAVAFHHHCRQRSMDGITIIALGEPTRQTCVNLGWTVAATAASPTPRGVVEAVKAVEMVEVIEVHEVIESTGKQMGTE